MNSVLAMAASTSLDLAGIWQLESADGRTVAPAAVPGDMHSALIAAGKIPHPYKGRNEAEVQWVAQADWVLSRTFDLPDNFAPHGWYLDISYLDTVADVALNGVVVLSAKNTFRRYRPEVSHALMPGENRIEIRFRSNIAAGAEEQAKQPFFVPWHEGNSPIPNGNMLRKPQCHFGWDWNLAIAPFGLYGGIHLKRCNTARIEHVEVRQLHLADGTVEIFTVTRGAAVGSGGPVSFGISFNGEIRNRHLEVGPGEFAFHEHFVVTNPKLWWPAGSGDQPLYPLEVSLDGETVTRQIGLRNIELVTTPDQSGNRFLFKVNGAEIFCRGSNWIPADALPSAATPELTAKLLKAAVDANQNMIRVWGGGFYEQDFFYDLCDRLGLLVWQDFMFACNLYPSTPDFLDEVREEVDYQVRRLQHHACLALWCGDNELIGALTWFEVSRKDRDRYLVSYDRLNRTIDTALKAAEPDALWWPSSPSPGPMSFGDAWHDDSSGDMHFWSVWHEGKNFEHYRDVRPRFCSEFGFQSFPSLKIAKGFAGDADLNISSPVMESHQKNAGGNARIAETMFRYFRFPMNFADFVYLSQIQQGLAIKTAVEFWRSLKPHTMGTLYWQLNDTWPVASWASLDHGGGWKIMHHMVQRFYQPAAIFAVPSADGEAIRLVGVNDTRDGLPVDVTMKSVGPDGLVRQLGSATGVLPPDKALDLSWLSTRDIGEGHILMVDFKAANGMSGRVHHAPVPYKKLDLVSPQLHVETKMENGTLCVALKSKALALFVSLETDEPGRFEDGGFDMLAGEERVIRFIADEGADLARAASSLRVRDLHSAIY